MKTVIIRYGIIGGLVSILLSFAMLNGLLGTWSILGITLLTFILIQLFAGLDYKKSKGGFASFRDLLKVVFGTLVLSTLISTVVSQVYMATLSDERKEEIITDFADTQLESIKSMGIEPTIEMEDDIIKQSGEMFDVKTLIFAIPMNLLLYGFFGLIISLIIKKEPHHTTL